MINKGLDMLKSPLTGYLTSGATFTGGAVYTAQEAQHMMGEPIVHTIYGWPISEVALLMGILGTVLTCVFQYMNYRTRRDYYKSKTKK